MDPPDYYRIACHIASFVRSITTHNSHRVLEISALVPRGPIARVLISIHLLVLVLVYKEAISIVFANEVRAHI